MRILGTPIAPYQLGVVVLLPQLGGPTSAWGCSLGGVVLPQLGGVALPQLGGVALPQLGGVVLGWWWSYTLSAWGCGPKL